VAVLLQASHHGQPVLADCRLVLLSDPRVPGSVQPYHAALVQHRLQNMGAAAKLVAVVEQATGKAVNTLLDEYTALGLRPRAATLVVGSLVDPSTIANQHMRAHALEGHLFRTTLANALEKAGVRTTAILERNAYDHVATTLEGSPDRLKLAVKALGGGHRGPWRADEKLAAVAAWMNIPGHSTGVRK
jgi:hypothetical protein